jgi:hypothetical protein
MYRLLNVKGSNKNKICSMSFIVIGFGNVAEMEDSSVLEVC